MIIFYFKHESADFENNLLLRDNQCKEIRVDVRRENLRVPETKRAALLKALVRGCSVVFGSP